MVRFKMVGRDINSNPTQYRTWIVSGQPDYAAQFYTGLKSGPNAFVDVFAVEIDNPTVVANFNLPIPTDWYQIDNQLNVSFPIRKVLPATMESGHFCILDGYAYVFGGKVTNQIFQCNLNNPGDWIVTDGYLPSILYGASLAITDGYIWLFGGNNGNESDMGRGVLDTVYAAPLSNPLQWTNYGSRLPRHLQYSNLAITGGQIYLFGGQEINDASNVIFTAPTSNPLNWTDTGARLPTSVYKSAFGQVNGNFMIFGGLLFPDTPSNLIWSAPVSSPLNWAVTGALPYECALGKFINIGGDGYIFTPTVSPTPTTSFCNILQANLQVNPNLWYDIQKTIPANLSNSNIAVIYDRIWFFGGSGLTAMFACNQQLKYSFIEPKVYNYGFISRTVFQATDNINNPLLALSIPWWLTDYPFSNRP
jgi:hypothetical protein